MVSLSQAAYYASQADYLGSSFASGIAPYVPGFNLTASIYGSDTDTNGFVGMGPSGIYVVFRGSYSATSFANDNKTDLVAYTDSSSCLNCNVHEGWYSAAKEVWKDVLSAVTSLNSTSPGAQVFVTGHSSGGAIATFIANFLIQEGYPTNVLTFG